MNKIINKKTITFCTIFIYLVLISIFEIGYCNSEFFINKMLNKESIQYNFSLIRIVVYIVGIIIYAIARKKAVEEAVNTTKNKYKRIYIYISLIIAILILAFYSITIIKNPIIVRGMTIGMMTILMAALFSIYISNNATKNVILVISTFGIVFTVATSFNHAIDEKKHFMTAFNIANFNLDYTNNPITDKKLEELNHLTKFTSIDNFLKEKYIPEITHDVNMEDVPSTPATYPFLVYIFPAIGIFIAKTVGGSIIDMYILGRIFNLILYGILTAIAIKIVPFKKNIFAIIFCMPMLLLLAASYSIDGYCVGLVTIFIAYCMKLYEQKEKIKLKQFLILFAIFALMLMAKSMAYICVSIIVLILPIIKILKENKKYLPIIITIFIIALVAIMGLILYIKQTQLVSDTRGGQTNVTEQLNILLNNPKHDVKLATNQIKETLLSFTWYTNLHQNVFFTENSPYVMFAIMLFVLYVSITEDDHNFKLKDKIIMTISFLAVFAMTSAVLYLTFTPIGALHVAGYQTRYILPILPLILFSLSSNKINVKKSENRTMKISIISGVLLIIGLAQLIIV